MHRIFGITTSIGECDTKLDREGRRREVMLRLGADGRILSVAQLFNNLSKVTIN